MTDSREKNANRYVGEQLRILRGDMPQKVLGKKLGLSHGMVGQMERGEARVSAGRLFLIAQALDVPVSEFFPPQYLARKQSSRAGSGKAVSRNQRQGTRT